nr:hypothetical protein [uncultured Pseudomonas sp.]
MSDQKVTPFRTAPDKLDAILKAEGKFESDLVEAVRVAQLAGVPQSMLVGQVYSLLASVEAGMGFIVDGDEPA